MKDHYIFDYNVIAKLDPGYKQYLTDELPPQDKNIMEILPALTAEASRATLQTLRYHTSSGTDLTDADRGIIDLVSCTDARPPIEPVRRRGAVNSMSEMAKTEQQVRTLYLKPEFKNIKLNGRKMCSPRYQLCPPKNVLGPGSVVYEDKKIYTMAATGHRLNQDAVLLHKSSVSISGDKIRQVQTVYWFDRVRNVTSEKSAHTKLLVYNKKTKQLYKLYKIKLNSAGGTRKRYKYKINSVLMNYQLCTTHLVLAPYIADKFIKEIEKVVKHDVPDAYVPPLNPKVESLLAYTLEMLILQHKLGKRVDWLDKTSYVRASEILHYTFGHNIGSNTPQPQENSAKNHKKKIGNFISHLRKYTNYTSLIEAVFGHLYHKLLLKILPFNLDTTTLELIAYSLKNNLMPKSIRHLLHAILNSELASDGKRRSLLSINKMLYHDNTTDTDITNAWVTTALRFIKNNEELPSAYTWRDTYEMAARYHVRIRPRKFNNIDDIQVLHDRLVAIQNRDRVIVHKYRNRVFLHFDHPDKLYDGFQFTFLGTPEALKEEGILMHHCVGGYASRCISGYSAIFSMKKDDVRYVTVELDGSTYKVKQKYTINDNLVNNDTICNTIETWEKDVIRLHKDDEVSYQELCNPTGEPVDEDEDEDELIPATVAPPSMAVITEEMATALVPMPVPVGPVRDETYNQLNDLDRLVAMINTIACPLT